MKWPEIYRFLFPRNNTDRNLDRPINWQYLLPSIKLFYILPTIASTPSTDGIKVWARHCLNSEVHLSCCVCHWVHKSLHCTRKRPACYRERLSFTRHHLRAFQPTIRTQEKEMSSPSDVTKLLQDALDTQPTIIGQPNDDDLLSLKEKLLDFKPLPTTERMVSTMSSESVSYTHLTLPTTPYV